MTVRKRASRRTLKSDLSKVDAQGIRPHEYKELPNGRASGADLVLISATVLNSPESHDVRVRTGNAMQSLNVAPKSSGRGSSVNGGELLMLALATCYCNDLFREAGRLGICIEAAEVEASAEYPGVGLAATNIRYRAKVQSSASLDDIAKLLRETDVVAEVHNTLRAGATVELLNNE